MSMWCLSTCLKYDIPGNQRLLSALLSVVGAFRRCPPLVWPVMDLRLQMISA